MAQSNPTRFDRAVSLIAAGNVQFDPTTRAADVRGNGGHYYATLLSCTCAAGQNGSMCYHSEAVTILDKLYVGWGQDVDFAVNYLGVEPPAMPTPLACSLSSVVAEVA